MKLVLSILLTLVFLFSGCSAMEKTSNSLSAADQAMPAAIATPQGGLTGGTKEAALGAQAALAKAQAEPAKMPEAQHSEPLVSAPLDRKIIRNGEFAIETKTPTEDQRKLQFIAESLGGFVVTSEYKSATSRSEDSTMVNVILRVPSANFQKATDEIVKLGLRVLHQKTMGQDVTAEYVDLEARLRAKKALEAQYFEIMKRASKISDVLEVQQKLTEVRTEIEQAEGRRRYLDNQSALSTINISLQTPAPLVAATQTGFWASVKNSFGDGVDVAVAIVLGIIHFVIVMLPVFVLILLPAGLIARVLWKRVAWPRKEVVGIVPPPE
jgi:hypothetical protein